MTFTEIDVNTYSGNVPTGTDLVVAESGDVEESGDDGYYVRGLGGWRTGTGRPCCSHFSGIVSFSCQQPNVLIG